MMGTNAQTRLREQLCKAARSIVAGEVAKVPEAGRDLWKVFQSLSEARSFHRFGPNPIGFAEVAAWCALMGVPLAGHHVAILRAMDSAWVDAFYTRQAAAPNGVKTLPAVSKQPLTAALFDIVSE